MFAAVMHIPKIQFITELHLGFALHKKYLKAEIIICLGGFFLKGETLVEFNDKWNVGGKFR